MGYGIISLAVNYRGISFLLAGVGLSLCILAAGCKKKDDTSPTGPSNPNKVKRMFVTRAVFDGNLGGLAGADAKCATAASAAGLGGTWISWLSDSSTNAIDRVSGVGPWYLVDGESLAFSLHRWTCVPPKGAALATTPVSTLNMTEYGSTTMSYQNYSVWTGSIEGGTYSVNDGEDCNGWTSRKSEDKGDRGKTSGSLRQWTGRSFGTDNLAININAATTSIPICDTTRWWNNPIIFYGTIFVGSEQMTVVAVIDATSTINVIRGANGTTATAHNAGDSVGGVPVGSEPAAVPCREFLHLYCIEQ